MRPAEMVLAAAGTPAPAAVLLAGLVVAGFLVAVLVAAWWPRDAGF